MINFLLKRLQMFYIFWANVSNVHKMLRDQTNVYATTFMSIILFQAYCKHNKAEITKTKNILRLTQKNTMLIKKCALYFLLQQHVQVF